MDLMSTYITEMGIPFLDREASEFIKFIKGSDKEKQQFFYEDYV